MTEKYLKIEFIVDGKPYIVYELPERKANELYELVRNFSE